MSTAVSPKPICPYWNRISLEARKWIQSTIIQWDFKSRSSCCFGGLIRRCQAFVEDFQRVVAFWIIEWWCVDREKGRRCFRERRVCRKVQEHRERPHPSFQCIFAFREHVWRFYVAARSPSSSHLWKEERGRQIPKWRNQQNPLPRELWTCDFIVVDWWYSPLSWSSSQVHATSVSAW